MRILFFLISFVGLGLFLWAIFSLDPMSQENRITAFSVFYGGVFLCVMGFFLGIFGSGFTNLSRGGKIQRIRQSMLLGILVCGILALQQWRIMFWWSGVLLVGGVCIVELGFLAFRSRKEINN